MDTRPAANTRSILVKWMGIEDASETDDEHRREREAQLRRANRLAERDEILRGR